ncbi:MAG: septation ring formation regulator EzrA [Mycoplasmataceae bacterium]|jgi:hypothetical protein|nr:septation ring formation regulator EzrA [Mycoplasmataceae bacterium]
MLNTAAQMILNGTNSNLHGKIIALIVLGGLFLIMFSIFSLVFFVHKKLLKREYKIKEDFNNTVQFLNINQFKHLEKLAKNNTELRTLMNSINEARDTLKKQSEVIRNKIMNITILNSRYLYRQASKLIREAENDLRKSSILIKSLRQVSASATQYSKNISDLLTEFRSITDKIANFYELNLSTRYRNDVFKNMYDMIKKIIIDATEYAVKIDNDKLLALFTELNSRVKDFYVLTIGLYELDHILNYLKKLETQITENLKCVEKSISKADFSEIERNLASGHNSTYQLAQNLKQLKLTDARKNAIIAVQSLEITNVNIKMGDETKVLIQRDMKTMHDQIAILSKEYGDVESAFNNIISYFGDNRSDDIRVRAAELTNEIKKISLNYQGLKSAYDNFDVLQRKKFLKNMSDLSIQIVEWKVKLNNLVQEIDDKYKTSILINDELSDIKLTLTQLLSENITEKKDEGNFNAIRNIILDIEGLQNSLTTDYFGHYVYVQKQMANVREQASLLISSATFDQTLKLYAKRLMFFTNKYRNEHADFEKVITMAEDKYRNNDYGTTISMLIEVLENVNSIPVPKTPAI